MWKTALLALIAAGLTSPCNVAGPAAYGVLLAHADRPSPVLDTEVGPVELDPLSSRTVAAALEQLGICRRSRPPGPLDRFFTWLGFDTPPGPGRLILAVHRLPDDRLVVATSPLGIRNIRDCAWITLHVVDRAGRVMTTGEFSAGYGFPIPSVTPALRRRLDGAVMIALGTQAWGGLRMRQYYALRHERLVLVRVEEFETRRGHKNHYGTPNYTVGPDLPALDADGWRARLSSEDPVLLLEALVWLGGIHLDVHRDPPESLHEEVASARVWEEVVTDEGTRARLRELASSSDPWIAEAARCAMEVERSR